MSQTDPGTLMERLRDGFRRLTENRMNLILICAVTGIILIAASYIWDEQAEPAESVSDAGTLLSADTRTLEQRLSEMVSRIDGAGRSCVMVLSLIHICTAFKFGANSSDPVKMYAADICTINVNIAGLPGISVPCGVGADGMPCLLYTSHCETGTAPHRR